MITPEIKVVPDAEAVAREAADRIVEQSASAINHQGKFSIALSGGSTPKVLFGMLAGVDYRTKIDWSNVYIYFGDERCVPPDSPESNYRMAKETLLDRAPIPKENVHRIRGEIEPERPPRLNMGNSSRKASGTAGSIWPSWAWVRTATPLHSFPAARRCTKKNIDASPTGWRSSAAWRVTMTAPFIKPLRAGDDPGRRGIQGPEITGSVGRAARSGATPDSVDRARTRETDVDC